MIEIKDIQDRFIVCEKKDTLFQVNSNANDIKNHIEYLTKKGFITLTQIACSDWIEDEVFTLNYILTTQKKDINLMVKVNIPRDDFSFKTISDIFPQAQVMERDLHEMYGIKFDGNDTLYDFALEDWEDIPPLRREFDTLKFVNDTYEFKKGRDDNKDVKAETKRRKLEAKKAQEVQDGN